jgi:hypothetical protein
LDQLIETLYRLEKGAISVLTRLAQMPFWLFGTTVILSLYVYITAFPPFDLFDIKVWELTVFRGQNPFSPLPEYIINNHSDKFAFRFVGPIIGSVFGLSSYGYFIFHQLIAVCLVASILNYGFKITGDKLISISFAIGFCSLFMGKWGFYDMHSHFDALALLFIVLSLTSRHTLLVLITLLMSYFTDERALISSCLVFLIFKNRETDFNVRLNKIMLFGKFSLTVIISWILYFVIRTFLTNYYNLQTGHSAIGIVPVFENFKFMPLALLLSLEGFWIIVVIVVLFFFQQQKIFFNILYISGITIVLIVALMVYDISRSTAYLLPACLLAFEGSFRFIENSSFLRLIMACSLLSMVVPTMEFFNQVYWLGPVIPKIFKWI